MVEQSCMENLKKSYNTYIIFFQANVSEKQKEEFEPLHSEN